MKKHLSLISLIIILAAGILAVRFLLGGDEDAWICENGQWVQHGHPYAPMPAEGCSSQKKEEAQNSKADLIVVDQDLDGAAIQSPLGITGKARGYWFFEASFPIKLYDKSGNLIATAIAQAQSDWMTEDFVPFNAQLVFEVLEEQAGELVFEKDNPSGMPEHADELRFSVTMK